MRTAAVTHEFEKGELLMGTTVGKRAEQVGDSALLEGMARVGLLA
jgi:hypothetical protein